MVEESKFLTLGILEERGRLNSISLYRVYYSDTYYYLKKYKMDPFDVMCFTF
jgi:hypothetical protein